jgi:hypothetical protein
MCVSMHCKDGAMMASTCRRGVDFVQEDTRNDGEPLTRGPPALVGLGSAPRCRRAPDDLRRGLAHRTAVGRIMCACRAEAAWCAGRWEWT